MILYKGVTMELPYRVLSRSASDTENAGGMLADYIKSNGLNDVFIAMYGDLGAGKTTFVRGLCAVLVPGARVCSPTFTVVNEYRGDTTVRHCDAYRVEGEDDLYSVGFYDFDGGVTVVEWCEKIPFALPDSYIRVSIDKTDAGREIRIERIDKNAYSRN